MDCVCCARFRAWCSADPVSKPFFSENCPPNPEGLGVFLPALDFFLPAFEVTRKRTRVSEGAFCQHDCWREKARASPKVFFCQRVWCQKRPRGGARKRCGFARAWGCFFCQRICRLAQVRGEMQLRKGVPVPCEGEKTQRKNNFETWALREKLHNPARSTARCVLWTDLWKIPNLKEVLGALQGNSCVRQVVYHQPAKSNIATQKSNGLCRQQFNIPTSKTCGNIAFWGCNRTLEFATQYSFGTIAGENATLPRNPWRSLVNPCQHARKMRNIQHCEVNIAQILWKT